MLPFNPFFLSHLVDVFGEKSEISMFSGPSWLGGFGRKAEGGILATLVDICKNIYFQIGAKQNKIIFSSISREQKYLLGNTLLF